MRVPSVRFNESNVGITPIRQGIRNRIGIVGDFSRGPANIPTFITGYTDFASRYGSDIKKASLAYQAAFDQGAEDFCLVRVLGNSKVAKGSVTFSNIASKSNTLLFHLKFIGEVIDRGLIPLNSIVSTTGKYTGITTGRYYFNVTSISGTQATVKYVFYALGSEPSSIDWAAITSSIIVDLASDRGVPKLIANGLSLTFGYPSQTENISLKKNDEWSVRVNTHTFSIPINQGDLPNQVVTSFIDEVVGKFPIGEITRNSADNGAVFSLDTDLQGSIGNKYSYYFEFLDPTSPGVSVSPSSASNSVFFQGGEDGPRNAVRDFYTLSGIPLLRLVAVSEGSWGNQLRVTIYPLSKKQFRISIEDLNASNFNPKLDPESYIIDFSDVGANGEINQLNSSIYVRGFFIPKLNNPNDFEAYLLSEAPQRLAPPDVTITDTKDERHSSFYGPSKLINITLENGYDGPELTENDYIAGLTSLESLPVHIVLCPGVYDSPNIRASLISHAEQSHDLEGLRLSILNARPNLIPNSAKQETLGLDSKRAVMVVGWSSYSGQPNAPRFGLSPDAIYAGKLAAIPFYAGPNARRTAGGVNNITEVDSNLYSSTASLQIYTDSRLEILSVDPATQSFTFVNGRTLSSDTAWDKVYIRRTYDIIRQDLYEMLQQYKGEPHTNLLRAQITSAINAYMAELLRNSQIANYSPAIADSTNNSSDTYLARQLNISLSFLPLYSIDDIVIALIRDSQTGLVSFGS